MLNMQLIYEIIWRIRAHYASLVVRIKPCAFFMRFFYYLFFTTEDFYFTVLLIDAGYVLAIIIFF